MKKLLFCLINLVGMQLYSSEELSRESSQSSDGDGLITPRMQGCIQNAMQTTFDKKVWPTMSKEAQEMYRKEPFQKFDVCKEGLYFYAMKTVVEGEKRREPVLIPDEILTKAFEQHADSFNRFKMLISYLSKEKKLGSIDSMSHLSEEEE